MVTRFKIENIFVTNISVKKKHDHTKHFIIFTYIKTFKNIKIFKKITHYKHIVFYLYSLNKLHGESSVQYNLHTIYYSYIL